jgi:two-component system sensor histidine kinase SenX3
MDAAALVLLILLVVAIGLALWSAARYRSAHDDMSRVLERLDLPVDGRRDAEQLTAAIARLEREVEEAESQSRLLQAAADGTHLGIIVADDAGMQLFANPAAEQIQAGRLGDAVVRGRVLQLVERVTKSGNIEELEFDLYTPVRRVVQLRAVPFDDVSRGTIVYIRDLTDQHHVDVVRRDFVTNAGHELKTPLGALSVLAEAITDTDDPEIRRRLADRIAAEAGRMASVVEDILQLAAVESLEEPHEPVVVADVLRVAAETEAVSAAEAGIALVGKLPGTDVSVSGSFEQLASAVGNLLDNAIKYTAVAHGAGTVWYRGWQDADRVFVEVEDQGIGIGEAHQSRIFERFYRVDRARSRASGGTGLGLSIVRNVVRTHGGDVSIRSELGVGTTFTIELPTLRE